MNCGLCAKELEIIQEILNRYEAIQSAVLFGSSVTGNFKTASDIDIALKGAITIKLIAKIKAEFEDSTLPFFVDIVDYAKADNALKNEIDTQGVMLYPHFKATTTTWQRVKLGEIAEVINGYAFKSSDFLTHRQADSLPIIKIKNVANGDVNFDNVVFCRFDKKLEKFLIQENDILISLTGNHPHAKSQVVGQISKYRHKNLAFLNQRVAKIIANKANKDFLYFLFKWQNIHNDLANRSSGSGNQANISSNDILNLEISLPPLKTQRKIAEILSSLDDKIDLLHRQNKTLESLALTLFRHSFIDNPKRNEWQIGKLGDYGNIICGKTPPKSQKEYFNGEIPFIKIPDMHHNTFIVKTADTLTQKGLVFQSTKTLPPFSVCVSCIATVGLVSMNTQISQTNQQINSIIPHKEHFRYFLYCFMKESFNELQAMASGGTATMNLNTTEFSKMPILKPSNKELQDFHSCVKVYFDKIYNNVKQIQNLESLRDIMLPKLLSGEMEV